MVRLTPTVAYDHQHDHLGSMPILAIGLFISVSALVALCAKHAIRRSSKKPESDSSPQKPRAKTTNDKGGSLVHCDKTNVGEADHQFDEYGNGENVEEGNDVGEDELWQKAIIMGEKCQPPEFSGGIYYDYDGNRIAEMPPKSPRAVSQVVN